jgi:hypothetical protein
VSIEEIPAMQQSSGKPILGSLLGATLAGITVAILQQGAVLLPTRLVVFGLLGIGASVGSLVLTTAVRSRAVLAAQSVAALSLAFALTGIPAMSDSGGIDGGCTASASTGSSDPVTPADTSVVRPLAIDTEDTVVWQASTPAVFHDWYYAIRIDVAGFPIAAWSDADSGGAIGPSWDGNEDLTERLGELEDVSGLTVTGVYHLWGSIRGDEGACDAEVYVRITPDHLFDGPILVGLWTAAAIALLVFSVYLTQVRGARGIDGRERPRL